MKINEAKTYLGSSDYRKAFVCWSDSQIFIEQMKINEADFDICLIYSVGFILENDDDKIVLASDIIGINDARRVLVIPKENIKTIKFLE